MSQMAAQDRGGHLRFSENRKQPVNRFPSVLRHPLRCPILMTGVGYFTGLFSPNGNLLFTRSSRLGL